MAVTIRDVAERAGVAKSVVSTVLNGRETSTTRVSEETSRRVRQAALDLHYRPNALARGLAQKRTDILGIVPLWAGYLSVWSGFVSEMMQGVAATALRERYSVLLSFEQHENLEQQVSSITDGRIDGALLWRPPSDPLAQRLQEVGFPVVMMFGHHENRAIWSVDCDNFTGGRLATEYLISLGHSRILHLTGDPRHSYVRDRRLGYEQTMESAGLPVRPEWILNVGWELSGEEAYDHVRRQLARPERPTAVFAWYDGVALQVLRKASEWGLRVPDDFSIIGFDSTTECAYTSPPLTSVRQPIEAIAACAATMLIQKIRGESIEQVHHVFSPTLDVRASCLHGSGRP